MRWEYKVADTAFDGKALILRNAATNEIMIFLAGMGEIGSGIVDVVPSNDDPYPWAEFDDGRREVKRPDDANRAARRIAA